MFQPIISNSSRQKENFLNTFGGLNRKEYAKENEFADMENLCSDKFPYISARKSRDKDSSLTYSDGEIRYSGKYATHCNYTSGERLINFNKKILRFPTNTYCDYEHTNEDKNIEISNTDKMEFRNSGSIILTDKYTTTWDKYFKIGDRVAISGTGMLTIDTVEEGTDLYYVNEWQPVTCIIREFSYTNVKDYGERALTMVVDCYNKDGEKIKFQLDENITCTATVKKIIPKISDACVLNNRVFGVDVKGKTIYASKLGSFDDWFKYEGISTDSWYGEVGTEGEFTGIVEFNGSIIAFKRDYIYKIYGDTPKNFTIQKQSSDGCIDKKSIVELNGRLYFLSQNGFCVYSGGYPTIISEVLNKRYINATSGTDGRKIYFYATADDGTKELLVYDTVFNMWHLEDTDNDILSFFRYNGELYFVENTNKSIYKVNGNGYADEWHFKTQEYNTLGMNYTLLSDIAFYASSADKSKSCTFSVYIMYDGAEESEKVFCGSFMLAPNTTQRIPIKLKQCFSYSLMVEGTGPIIIKNIEKAYTSGGKNEGNRR